MGNTCAGLPCSCFGTPRNHRGERRGRAPEESSLLNSDPYEDEDAFDPLGDSFPPDAAWDKKITSDWSLGQFPQSPVRTTELSEEQRRAIQRDLDLEEEAETDEIEFLTPQKADRPASEHQAPAEPIPAASEL